MNESAQLPFRKMNGLGNDFVVLDARARPLKIGSRRRRSASATGQAGPASIR